MCSVFSGLFLIACQVVYNCCSGYPLSIDANEVHRVVKRQLSSPSTPITLPVCEADQTDDLPPSTCQLFKDTGFCNDIQVQTDCPVTCGVCLLPATTAPPAPSTPITLPVCEPDQTDDLPPSTCQLFKDTGFCNDIQVQTDCPVTCGVCLLPPTTAPPGPSTPITLPVCEPDQTDDLPPSTCQLFKDTGFCNDIQVQTDCPVTCGVCLLPPTTAPPGPSTPITLPVCEPDQTDDLPPSTCQLFKDTGFCNDIQVKTDCPVTCGVCLLPPTTTAPPVTTPSSPTTPEAATTPQSLTTPEAATTPQSPTTPEAATTPQSPTTPENATTPQSPTTPENATTPQSPTTPENATTPQSPTTPENATTPQSPTTPENATTPQSPTTPENATTPQSPTTPENETTLPSPTTPENATTPQSPTTPENVTTLPSPTTPENVTTLPSPTTPENVTTLPFPTTPENATTPQSPTTPENVTTLPSPTTPENVTTTPPTPTTGRNETTTPPTPSPPVCCIFVTLVVYSGRQDPRWLISLNDTYNNYTCEQILSNITQARNSSLVHPHSCIPPKTGYKGFLVQTGVDEDLIIGNETIPLQLLLLYTMPERLQPTVSFRQRIRSEIVSGKVAADCPAVGKRRKRDAPPTFEPAPWSTLERTRRLNNCYNYATNLTTSSYAQPGRGSGGPFYPWVTADAIRDAAINDGLVVLNPNPTPPAGETHIVALFVSNDTCGGDFHFYRLDNSSTWSHKPGQTRVTDLDDSKNIITDPTLADTGNYMFVQRMIVDRDKITVI